MADEGEDGALPQSTAQDDQDLREELFGADSDEEEDALKELSQPAEVKRKPQVEAEEPRTKKRLRRAQQADEEAKEPGPAPELAEEPEEAATAADRAFIDDEGVEEPEQEQRAASGSDSEDEGERGGPRPDDEAEEEDDEFEAIFKGQKSKRRRPAHAESVTKGVEDLLAHMEVAAERDMEATKDARPAFMKLKMLKEVVQKVRRKDWHEDLLGGGILGVLKAWLEPVNGCLPLLEIRTEVLRMLQSLPIDLTDEQRKSQMKKSQLGHVVMFLSKPEVEDNRANRRIARELVNRWSEQIYGAHRDERETADLRERHAQMQEARTARKRAEQIASAAAEGVDTLVLKPGDKGFRYHASIPQAARLDYLKRPDNAVAVDPESLKSRANKLGKVGKKIQTLNKKYTNAGSKAAKVSIEGRGLKM